MSSFAPIPRRPPSEQVDFVRGFVTVNLRPGGRGESGKLVQTRCSTALRLSIGLPGPDASTNWRDTAASLAIASGGRHPHPRRGRWVMPECLAMTLDTDMATWMGDESRHGRRRTGPAHAAVVPECAPMRGHTDYAA